MKCKKFPTDWEEIYKKYGIVQKRIAPICKRALEFFKRARIRTILDLGCGTGRHTIYFAKKGFEVTGGDVSKIALRIIKQIVKENKIKNIKIKKLDYTKKLPFKKESFDSVIMIRVLTHNTKRGMEKIIKRVSKLIKAGGFFVADFLSTKDEDFVKKRGKEIEPGTLIGLPYEEKVPHHFVSKKEIKTFFPNYLPIYFIESIEPICLSTKIQKLWRKKRAHVIYFIGKKIK